MESLCLDKSVLSTSTSPVYAANIYTYFPLIDYYLRKLIEASVTAVTD